MLIALKAELRKLLTVRSTYFVTGSVLLLVIFLSVYVFGYQTAAQPATSPNYMTDVIYTMLGTFVTFSAILSILLVAHEYRYNMITYTLTSSRSRLKVLFAKTLVMLIYATIIGLVVAALAVIGAKFGLGLAHKTLAPQNIPLWDTIWRFSTYTWGYTLIGLVIAMLLRGVVGSIVTFFMFPIAEQIASLIIKGNTKFLPFRALDSIAATHNEMLASLTNKAALGVFAIYFAVLYIAVAVSFVKRDAN